MKSLAHIYTRIVDTPLAIHPAKFEAILGAIGDRLGLELTAELTEAAAQPFRAADRKSYSIQSGIAIVPISGSLMKKTSGLMAASGSASYETITAQFQDALASPDVKGILLDIDSPGGEVSGMFELADLIHASRGAKPIFAVANDAAFSAAYALASAADKIYVTRTGGVGSVGVFCMHVDQSGADAKAGLKYTFIYAGDKKTDGNAHEPLSDSAKNDSQAEVDREYGMFTSLVARNRGKAEKAIKDTQAGVFFGENAVPLLADRVGTFEDALGDLVQATSLLNTSAHTITKSTREEFEGMAKKTELPIDELVAKHAAEQADDEYMDKDCDDKAATAAESSDDDEDEKKPSEDDEDEKASRAEAVRIVNLCTLAGMPALAATFLTSNYTVAQVEKALLKHRSEKSKEIKIRNTASAGAGVSAAERLKGGAANLKTTEEYKRFLLNNSALYEKYLSERNS